MMNQRVKVGLIAGGVLALAGLWLGASAYGSYQTASALTTLMAAPSSTESPWRWINLQHERGLLSSTGHVDVRFEPGCGGEIDDEPLTVRLDYKINHLLLPLSLMRFEWKATASGEAGQSFAKLFGAGAALQGQGTVGLTGALRSDMTLPELSFKRAGQVLQVAPSSGHVAIHGKALALDWKIDRVVMRGGGQALEAKDFSLDIDLENRQLGTGTVDLQLAQLGGGWGSIEGLKFSSKAKENGESLDMSFTPSIRKLQVMNQTVHDLVLEMALKGLHTASVQTLSTLSNNACGLESLTSEEMKQVAQAGKTLLAKGLVFGITKLHGRSEDGTLEGRLMLELAPATQPDAPTLAGQFKSNGELEISGKALNAQMMNNAVNSGFAVKKGDGLVSSFEYAKALLKVNGRTQDGGFIEAALSRADAAIGQAFAQLAAGRPAVDPSPQGEAVAEAEGVGETEPEQPSAEAAAPEGEGLSAEAPTPTPEPAPAAVAPAPTECTDVQACVRGSLASAQVEDVDTLRALATRIDGLAKPDMGNRAVARQINTVALEALRRSDFQGAVSQFRKAFQENPRDVEISSNLGYALVQAGQPGEAALVLQSALVLDPRRNSTWTPLAEALALSGKSNDALAALWIAYQWSGNRDKSQAFYQDRAEKEARPALRALYRQALQWVSGGVRPNFARSG